MDTPSAASVKAPSTPTVEAAASPAVRSTAAMLGERGDRGASEQNGNG
jgi:hypothetical protein